MVLSGIEAGHLRTHANILIVPGNASSDTVDFEQRSAKMFDREANATAAVRAGQRANKARASLERATES